MTVVKTPSQVLQIIPSYLAPFLTLSFTFLCSHGAALTVKDICSDFSQTPGLILDAERALSQNMDALPKLALGDIAYVAMASLFPGQNGISYKGLCLHIAAKSPNGIDLPAKNHDNARAVVALKSAKQAILGPDNQIVLLDGHHTYITSMLAGAETFPIMVVEDLSHLPDYEFWQTLIAQEKVYFADYLVESPKADRPPKRFSDLVNDPLRGAVDEALIFITMNDEAQVFLQRSAGLRIEIEMLPFCEFKLARKLYGRGVRVEKDSTAPTSEALVELIHRTLRALDADGAAVPGIVLFEKPLATEEIVWPKPLKVNHPIRPKELAIGGISDRS
jgi:hypothetical protein